MREPEPVPDLGVEPPARLELALGGERARIGRAPQPLRPAP